MDYQKCPACVHGRMYRGGPCTVCGYDLRPARDAPRAIDAADSADIAPVHPMGGANRPPQSQNATVPRVDTIDPDKNYRACQVYHYLGISEENLRYHRIKGNIATVWNAEKARWEYPGDGILEFEATPRIVGWAGYWAGIRGGE